MENDLHMMRVGGSDESRDIAVRRRDGAAPGVLWLGGFKSDMKGAKAAALDEWAKQSGRAFVRFDYSGHGESGGSFADGTIGRWLEDTLAVFERFCSGPQVIVGSSMGGWIALLLLRGLRRRAAGDTALPASVAGLVLIAPAVDFTEKLMWEKFSLKVRRQITETGQWLRPSSYGDAPYAITHALIEDGRKHLMLDRLIETGCPVRILQGVQDEDVPWQHANELVTRLAHDDVVLTLVKDGDHRLSRPEDIERLIAAVAEFA